MGNLSFLDSITLKIQLIQLLISSFESQDYGENKNLNITLLLVPLSLLSLSKSTKVLCNIYNGSCKNILERRKILSLLPRGQPRL